MLNISILLAVLLYFISATRQKDKIADEEQKAKEFMKLFNKKKEELLNRQTLAYWAYASNMTEENLEKQMKVTAEVAEEEKKLWFQVTKFDWKQFTDYELKRQFKKCSNVGKAALSPAKETKLSKAVSKMENIYSTAEICSFTNRTKCDLALEPELLQIFKDSFDPEELKYVWVEWRKEVGPKCKKLFEEYVDLSNEAARLNNFSDNGESWLENYEDPLFKQTVESLWKELRPLYLQVHAYVRFHLRKKYGNIISENGHIPAHLLGDMWSQDWRSIASFMMPYPNKKEKDFTKEMRNQKYTVEKIFKTAEEFYKSINLTEMSKLFWDRSVLVKPKNRDNVCHASAWDFSNGEDFRIKQCTEVTFEHFRTTHHEMGHIEYFIQYKNQPVVFREGANGGFHEAIGDTVLLSVESSKHLQQLGLLTHDSDDESILNNLFLIGMNKIVFLPYAYLLDLWRWDVFAGKVTPKNYNLKWWELRQKYQGIKAPVPRSEENFDPAAKYHVIADSPYIRYFVSFIIQFQFHRSLCEKAGQYVPGDPSKALHKCDIYQSTNAGNAFKKMLQMGSSRPWPDAMEVLTGQRNIDASALLEYFKPLKNWLERENKKNGVHVGWKSDEPRSAPRNYATRIDIGYKTCIFWSSFHFILKQYIYSQNILYRK